MTAAQQSQQGVASSWGAHRHSRGKGPARAAHLQGFGKTCVCVCVYICGLCVYVCVSVYICVSLCICVHTSLCVCVCLCLYMCLCTCVYTSSVCICVCLCVYMCLSVYMCAHVSVCVYACACVYICVCACTASQVVLVVKKLPANAEDLRDVGFSPGLGRPPGGGQGNALQHSYLENPMDRGDWRATVHGVVRSQT